MTTAEKEPLNGRATTKDVWEIVNRLEDKVDERFVTKIELRLWVVLGIVGGQTSSAAITAFLHVGPVAQAAYLYGRIKGWA